MIRLIENMAITARSMWNLSAADIADAENAPVDVHKGMGTWAETTDERPTTNRGSQPAASPRVSTRGSRRASRRGAPELAGNRPGSRPPWRDWTGSVQAETRYS